MRHKEPEVAGYVCIADRLGPEESRWYIAHALGHKMMHPGNHLWIYKKTMLGYRYDGNSRLRPHPAHRRPGGDRGGPGLLPGGGADYLGVPEEFVRVQAPMEFG